jgi:hypothetical protein
MGGERRETGERKARAAQRAYRKGAQLIGEGRRGGGDKSLHGKTMECIEALMVPDDDSCEVNQEWRRTFVTLANTCLLFDETASPAMRYIGSLSPLSARRCLSGSRVVLTWCCMDHTRHTTHDTRNTTHDTHRKVKGLYLWGLVEHYLKQDEDHRWPLLESSLDSPEVSFLTPHITRSIRAG